MASSHIAAALPSAQGEHDAAILRKAATQMADPATRAATLSLAEGLESSGAVVARLEQMLSPQEAADLVGVSRQYIDKLIADKKLVAVYKPASRHRLIKVADLAKLEQERQKASKRLGETINEIVDAGAEY
jgi:excisionase family DNA binding protein